VRKPYKNPNYNARFVAAGFCATEFSGRSVKFHKAGSRRAKFYAAEFAAKDEKFCGAEPEAHDAALRGFKFCNERLLRTQQIPQSRHSHFKFNVEKFNGANFATCGTEFLGANFRGMEFCKSKFRARGIKFYKAELRETGFLARTAKFYATKFHGAKFQEMKFQTPNLELKMKFNAARFGEVKFRGGALLKFAAAKELRRSPSLCAVTPFKFTAPQNAGFFETKFSEARFYDMKFNKARSHRAKFYAAEFAAKDEKFCGAKQRGASA